MGSLSTELISIALSTLSVAIGGLCLFIFGGFASDIREIRKQMLDKSEQVQKELAKLTLYIGLIDQYLKEKFGFSVTSL